jgi:glycosyltransferase involved in cell wall biosynthesis
MFMDRPLLSYLVATYNQEEYVREAIKSALAQTYSPLEIIISDDCSRDRTFCIASDMAAAYKGPHKIRLNRNPINLGIGAHCNRVMEMCRGKLLVAAAGDDISVPTRTEVIFQAWEQSGRRATSICSSYSIISSSGTDLGVGGFRGNASDTSRFQEVKGRLFEFLATNLPVVNGCTHAWSPELFNYFGPLQADLEDLTLSFRTLAIGTMIYVNEPLVKYRRHEANVSFSAGGDDCRSFEHREKRLRWVDEKTIMAYDNMLADIATLCAKGRLSVSERDRLQTEARRIRNIYAVERKMMDGNIFKRFATLLHTAKQGNVRGAVRSVPRALPRRMYRALYLMRDRWRANFARKRGPLLPA